MKAITPFLWFDDQAEEAARYYVSIFNNSKIENVSHYSDAGPLPAGTVMTVEFQLEGQDFMALNGGSTGSAPETPHAGAIALFVSCPTQREVDELWDKLCDGGKKLQCGWVTDKFGVTWNIVPQGLGELFSSSDRDAAQRAMKAMLQMEKLDIEELRRAYAGVK